MSERQSQRSVALSAQHRQEAEVAAAETAATAAMLAMAELTAARAEVEAAAAADAARAAAAELKATSCCSSMTSPAICGLWSLAGRERLRTPSGACRPLRRRSAAVSCVCYAPTMAVNSRRMNSRRTARMRVFSATTPRRTTHSIMASSSDATR
jgi:hypothetical protein